MEKLVLVARSSTPSMADLTPLRTCTNEGEFNAFLVKIADEITKDEVQQMKFLCMEQNNNLPRGKLDEIKEPREFVNFLRQRGKISPEDVGYLIGLLDKNGNIRLADMIRERGKKMIQTTVATCMCIHPRCILFCAVDHARNQTRSQFNFLLHRTQSWVSCFSISNL